MSLKNLTKKQLYGYLLESTGDFELRKMKNLGQQEASDLFFLMFGLNRALFYSIVLRFKNGKRED
ncbi:hypothetical protein VCHA35O135_130002 [Vibrio chagasii]|nr:hypothetical protein VCHA35O135_130002 [Vibrio chagasii]